MQNLAMLQQMLPIQQAPTATLPQAGFVGYEQISPGNTRSLVGNLPPSQVIGPPMGNPSGVAPTYTIFQPSDLTALNHQLVQYYPIPTPPPTQVTAMVPTTASIRADRLEVCRDYQRGNCTRGEFECRYAHPPDLSMVDPGENTVIVCMDCIKGRCIRDKCKYFHPPMHLQAKIRATQNPTSPFLPSMPSPSVSSPQPSVMMSNPTPMPHSPLKRHNIEPQMIPSAGNPIGNPTALTQTSSNSPNPVTLTAMYGYNGITYPGLTNAHHQALSTVPAYYQHAMPIHLPYGVVTNAIHPGQINPLGVFNMPTTSKSDGNVMLK